MLDVLLTASGTDADNFSFSETKGLPRRQTTSCSQITSFETAANSLTPVANLPQRKNSSPQNAMPISCTAIRTNASRNKSPTFASAARQHNSVPLKFGVAGLLAIVRETEKEAQDEVRRIDP